MGIQGLLPALKPIQEQKHLSEFAGQTLAVDGYVWLHRAVISCATEIATGKPTRKYVEYCMQRVRLMLHHGIKPYLVFDGGPLPAKQGTEDERERRRMENLEKANTLSAQGKHSQARDFYVKCVDVTPQMAYQVIKALKAESIPYVVAPYEADAQLFFLERNNIVDGIITEDSDLLVFGCRKVMFKLDTTTSTVICISRTDFGSPSLSSESFSLAGWTDAQFRWMTMLSGCDYLPSIPGIGLKTAYTLLKKYKTAERVIKSIRLEGKRDVPKGYLKAFSLAEKVFLYQRVYDPREERLVHLSEVPRSSALAEDVERFVGKDLDPNIAKGVAIGDLCPISLKIMDDINPSFSPANKSSPLRSKTLNMSNEKGKARNDISQKGLLSYFTSVGKPESPKVEKTKLVVGKASGKRTLVDLVDEDAATRKKHRISDTSMTNRNEPPLSSRFFAPDHAHAISGTLVKPLTIVNLEEKENEPIDRHDPVSQEEGYLSPSSPISRNLTPDISSPFYSKSRAADCFDDGDDVSSPEQPKLLSKITDDTPTRRNRTQCDAQARILVRDSCEPSPQKGTIGSLGPDLSKNFDDDRSDTSSSEIGCWDEEDERAVRLSPSPSLSATPPEPTQTLDSCEDIQEDEDVTAHMQKAANLKVARGWKSRYSFGDVKESTRANDTPLAHQYSHHSLTRVASHGALATPPRLKKTVSRNLRSLNSERFSPINNSARSHSGRREEAVDDLSEERTKIKQRLNSFRYKDD